MSARNGGEVVAPIWLGSWDVLDPAPAIPELHESGVAYASALVLVRCATEPLGTVSVPAPLTGDALAKATQNALSSEIATRMQAAGLDFDGKLSTAGLLPEAQSREGFPWLIERQAALAASPLISVVLCTRGRTEQLGATLTSIANQRHPRFEVVLVDNAPEDDGNKKVLEAQNLQMPVHYVVEPRGGLSWARNAGTKAAKGDILVFVDDDEQPDPYWLAEYTRAFYLSPEAGAAVGPILPLRMDTVAEQAFEGLGGHSKGRGWQRKVFSAGQREQHPLYPLPPFGTGGNMAFRARTLAAIGGFDVALGAGTPARGAEDTAAIADVMLADIALVWQPSAFVRHAHFPTFEGAGRQVEGYGVGLAAFYARILLQDPRRIFALARLLPQGLGQEVGRTANHDGPQLPPEAGKRRRIGLARGPAAYLQSRGVQRAKE